LSELQEVEIWLGDTRAILKERGVGQIVTQNTPNLQLKALLEPFQTTWQPEVPFTDTEISEQRLKRFSRYWDKVGPELFGESATREP
jgi:deoxyribodipyrimidine photo-lyase